jgi:hypothetical protein
MNISIVIYVKTTTCFDLTDLVVCNLQLKTLVYDYLILLSISLYNFFIDVMFHSFFNSSKSLYLLYDLNYL